MSSAYAISTYIYSCRCILMYVLISMYATCLSIYSSIHIKCIHTYHMKCLSLTPGRVIPVTPTTIVCFRRNGLVVLSARVCFTPEPHRKSANSKPTRAATKGRWSMVSLRCRWRRIKRGYERSDCVLIDHIGLPQAGHRLHRSHRTDLALRRDQPVHRWHSVAHRWHSAAPQVYVRQCITPLEMACQLLFRNHRTDLALWRDQQRAAWLDVCGSHGTVYQVSNAAALATAQMVHFMAQPVRQKPLHLGLCRDQQRAAWLDVCGSHGTVYQVSNAAALATAQMVHCMAQTVRQKPIAEVLLRCRGPETVEAPASENTQVRPTPEPQIEAFGTARGRRGEMPRNCFVWMQVAKNLPTSKVCSWQPCTVRTW